ncbi:hypothetical protein DFJ73DRAFT_602534, partial [Zopfochytrium polystomum]
HDFNDVLAGKVDPRATPAVPANADVVVAGAGMASLIYAIELKKARPETSIVIIEKSSQPSYKIGESSLAPLLNFLHSHVLPGPYLFRLFALKDGLDFALIDRESDGADAAAARYFDIGGVVHSIQMERPVAEMLLVMRAQQLGVKVFFGVAVPLFAARSKQQVAVPPVPTEIKAKVVADGTGLVRALVGKESTTKSFEGVNFHAYWAYFEEDVFKEEHAIRDWHYPTTTHLCFKEGWSWWIRLLSWRSTPTENMMDCINYLLQMHEANIEPANLPTIQTLSSTFRCTWKRIASIGFVVRNDMQDAFPPAPFVDNNHAGDGEKRFWAIAHAYPHLTRILRDSGRYTLLHDYYGATRGTYFSRKNMSYYQDVVAGAGWFALGIAVGFTTPLISPGLNAICIPTASLAASLTARQLGAVAEGGGSGGGDAADAVAAAAAAEYATTVARQLQTLREADLLLYNIFRHPRL